MKPSYTGWILLCALALMGLEIISGSRLMAEDAILLDELPEHVVASMEARARLFAGLPQDNTAGFEFFVNDLQKWEPGQTVRVAFLGGDSALHRDIADATLQITEACNLKLDFGLNPTTGKYRTWSESDANYSAEIRVSFDQSGYFSLVGADSVNPLIGMNGAAVGGRPNQRSLNLGGFHLARPASWKKTTRHEFLHALAFHHEHQSPVGGCDAQFRWEDDPGYTFARNLNGEYITDAAGRRPGIYTYLSGAPNGWGRSKVDHNLRQANSSAGTAGAFDRESIMLYRFPALFYVSAPNPCAPIGNGENLSAGDIAGLKLLYPHDTESIATQTRRRTRIKDVISKSSTFDSSVKQLFSK